MLEKSDFQNKEKIHNILDKYSTHLYYDYSNKINKIHLSKKECSHFWIDFIETFSSHLSKLNIEKRISFDFLALIFNYNEKSFCNIKFKFIFKKYPYLVLLNKIKLSNFQWYYSNQNNSSRLDLFYKLINLPTPFNDSRFSIEPIYTDCIQRGLNHSLWSSKRQGGLIKNFNPDTNEVYYSEWSSSYRAFYLDAKLGLAIYFKNKPSIIVSFNLGKNKTLFLHQIQCLKKDRGHYKLGKDWSNEVIKYLKSVFFDYKIHIISGKDAVNFIKEIYSTSKNSESYCPDEDSYLRIQNFYDSFFNHKSFSYCNIKYNVL